MGGGGEVRGRGRERWGVGQGQRLGERLCIIVQRMGTSLVIDTWNGPRVDTIGSIC